MGHHGRRAKDRGRSDFRTERPAQGGRSARDASSASVVPSTALRARKRHGGLEPVQELRWALEWPGAGD
jgi:hypothetical protein